MALDLPCGCDRMGDCASCRLVDTPTAARAMGVTVHAIRAWVRRGHLQVAGRSGRIPMYFLADVLAASDATRHRGGRRDT